MAKVLKTAAIIVGAAALVASGLGAAATALVPSALGTAASATAFGVSAATLTSIGAIAGAIAGVLSLASNALMPKGSMGGGRLRFTPETSP